MKLDTGIKRTVELLRAAGFDTTDSGDGKSKPEDERSFGDTPHVVIKAKEEYCMWLEARSLKDFVRSLGVEVLPIGRGDVYIEATYDPVDNSAVIVLFGLHDGMLRGET